MYEHVWGRFGCSLGLEGTGQQTGMPCIPRDNSDKFPFNAAVRRRLQPSLSSA